LETAKDIYLFSGLGADGRAFSRLDLSGFRTHLVQWAKPARRETLATYALRLSRQVTTPDPVLLGVSFGGMIAIEVAKHIRPARTILVSSAKTRAEIPPSFRLAADMGLFRLLPASWLVWPNMLMCWLFGAASPADKKLLASILRDSDPAFMKWALRKIARWDNTVIPPDVCHIHGTKDRLLPASHIRSFIPIPGGGHFMIANRHEAVGEKIRQILNGTNTPCRRQAPEAGQE